MGDLARDVLFRMPARDVIRYSRSPALMNLMHGQVPATIPKLLWLTLLSICIHPNGWYNYLILAKGRDSAYCTWIMHVDTCISVLWHVLVFFSKIPAPKRERELRKMRRSLGEREWNKLMYSDCRGRLQHKGSFGFVQNAEKIVQVACCFFLTETCNAENQATVYLIFTDMPGHHLISSRYFRLKYVWFSSDWHPLPSSPF